MKQNGIKIMKKIDKDLTESFTNTYGFYDKDINKLILLF